MLKRLSDYSRISIERLYSRLSPKLKTHAKTMVLVANFSVTIYAGYLIIPYIKNLFGWSNHNFIEHQEMIDFLELEREKRLEAMATKKRMREEEAFTG